MPRPQACTGPTRRLLEARRLFAILPLIPLAFKRGRRLFEGGVYSRKYGIYIDSAAVEATRRGSLRLAPMRFKPRQINSEGLPRGRRSPDGGRPHTGSGPCTHARTPKSHSCRVRPVTQLLLMFIFFFFFFESLHWFVRLIETPVWAVLERVRPLWGPPPLTCPHHAGASVAVWGRGMACTTARTYTSYGSLTYHP